MRGGPLAHLLESMRFLLASFCRGHYINPAKCAFLTPLYPQNFSATATPPTGL
nr:MAG TPA: hypothetical protein [Caudoviricetes sp.]